MGRKAAPNNEAAQENPVKTSLYSELRHPQFNLFSAITGSSSRPALIQRMFGKYCQLCLCTTSSYYLLVQWLSIQIFCANVMLQEFCTCQHDKPSLYECCLATSFSKTLCCNFLVRNFVLQVFRAKLRLHNFSVRLTTASCKLPVPYFVFQLSFAKLRFTNFSCQRWSHSILVNNFFLQRSHQALQLTTVSWKSPGTIFFC